MKVSFQNRTIFSRNNVSAGMLGISTIPCVSVLSWLKKCNCYPGILVHLVLQNLLSSNLLCHMKITGTTHHWTWQHWFNVPIYIYTACRHKTGSSLWQCVYVNNFWSMTLLYLSFSDCECNTGFLKFLDITCIASSYSPCMMLLGKCMIIDCVNCLTVVNMG